MTRQCGSCTKCCEGWLSANIYGQEIGEGNPCRFLTDKCSIYDIPRPYVCGEFRCGWLRDDGTLFDEWMRPDITDHILVFTREIGCSWYEIVPTQETISLTFLSYILSIAKQHDINIKYRLGESFVLIGNEEFKKRHTAG